VKRRFAAIDRDGTIIVERHYLSDPDQVTLLPGSAQGLRRMREAGFLLFVVTNQSAVGRGIISLDRLDQIHARMNELLSQEGSAVDGIFFCPHTPEDRCECRKPKAGLLHQAASRFEINLSEGFVIGDKPCDIDLGRSVSARTMLVRTGYGSDPSIASQSTPDFIVDDLNAAATVMLAERK
jgi:D-glycero-D-manno-heptose 1,7-bisphosphate phosphatase